MQAVVSITAIAIGGAYLGFQILRSGVLRQGLHSAVLIVILTTVTAAVLPHSGQAVAVLYGALLVGGIVALFHDPISRNSNINTAKASIN